VIFQQCIAGYHHARTTSAALQAITRLRPAFHVVAVANMPCREAALSLIQIKKTQNTMNLRLTAVMAASLILTGCASVGMAPQEESAAAKQFPLPEANSAGLYIYRNSFIGGALKKDIWLDGKCIGESAPDVFFYTKTEGGKSHDIDTESEFSPNRLSLQMEGGKNYFVRQYIKMGAFVGGAGLEQVSEEQGKQDIQKLNMAKLGNCNGAK
jgi:hypothetical protein